jgi:hypothetical protein
MNQLISYTQTSYGTYKVVIKDAYGDLHTVRTNDVEAIDRIREAGRNMTYNDAGRARLSYEALRNELADALAAVNNI